MTPTPRGKSNNTVATIQLAQLIGEQLDAQMRRERERRPQTPPMDTARREDNYAKQGPRGLTSAQRRRLNKKRTRQMRRQSEEQYTADLTRTVGAR